MPARVCRSLLAMAFVAGLGGGWAAPARAWRLPGFPPEAPAGSGALAAEIERALSSGEWGRVKALFHDARDPALGYLAARWADMRHGRLDPVAWEVRFVPFYSRAGRSAGQLGIYAREADGTRIGRQWDVEVLRFGRRWLVGEALRYDNQDTRIERHDLAIDLRGENGGFAVEDSLGLVSTGPDRRMFLRLASALRVTAAWTDAKRPVAFKQIGDLLYLERPALPGAAHVTVRYAGRLPAGPWDFVRPEGTGLRSEFPWYPRDPVAPPFAVYRARVTVPRGRQAIAVGDLDGIDRFDDGWAFQWTTPTAVDGLSVYAGAYERTEAQAGRLPLSTFLPASRRELAPLFLAETARAVDFYAAHFGAFPYHQLSLVETGFPGGYGAGSVVALPHEAFDHPERADGFLAHELAHAWTHQVGYRGSVGEQAFMAEGVASYLDILYHGARDGSGGLRRALMQAKRRYARVAGSVDDVPIARVDPASARGVYQAIAYDKAALVLHMLRSRVGAAAFEASLRGLYAEHAGQAIGIDDFRRAFERESHASLVGFFRQWLGRTGMPRVALGALRTRALAGGRTEISGRVLQGAGPYFLDLPIVVTTAQSGMVFQVPLRGRATAFRVVVPGRPRQLLVDPLADTLVAPTAALVLR